MLTLFIEFLLPPALMRMASAGQGLADLWSADSSPEESAAIAARNEEICTRLRAPLPGLSPVKDTDDYAEVCADDALSQEQVLRRFHRRRTLSGPWRGGELRFEVYDEVAHLCVPASASDARNRGEYTGALETLIAQVAGATGMQARVPGEVRSGNPDEVASAALNRSDAALIRMERLERKERLRQRLGMPSLVVLAALALLGTVVLVWQGVERGITMAAVDLAAPATFLVESSLPPRARLGLFPAFTLRGRIAETGEAVDLPVFRDQYLRAGPGAPFTVLRTGDPRAPYVLRSTYDSAAPVVRIGSMGLAWHTWLALLPPVLFYAWVLRPLRKAPPAHRAVQLAGVTGKLQRLLLLVAVMLAGVLAARLL